MMKPESFLRGAFCAWEMLIDVPLPAALRARFGGGTDTTSQLAGFPLVGAALGLSLALVGAICSFLFQHVAGSIAFALLCTLFLDWKDSGRGLGFLTSCFLQKQRGIPMDDALQEMTADWNRIGTPLSAVFVSLLEVGKAALLFTLAFCDAKLWILVILIGAFTVQGMLASEPERESGVPLLSIPQENRRIGWWVFGILYLILLPFFPFGVIVAGAVVVFCATGFAGYFLRNCGGCGSDLITLAGSLTELLLLVVGVLFALGGR